MMGMNPFRPVQIEPAFQVYWFDILFNANSSYGISKVQIKLDLELYKSLYVFL